MFLKKYNYLCISLKSKRDKTFGIIYTLYNLSHGVLLTLRLMQPSFCFRNGIIMYTNQTFSHNDIANDKLGVIHDVDK